MFRLQIVTAGNLICQQRTLKMIHSKQDIAKCSGHYRTVVNHIDIRPAGIRIEGHEHVCHAETREEARGEEEDGGCGGAE